MRRIVPALLLASLSAVVACSASPQDANGSNNDELRFCYREPLTDCQTKSGPDMQNGGFVVLSSSCAPTFLAGRTSFTGESSRQWLAEIPVEYQALLIPNITPAMQDGTQPFCVYTPTGTYPTSFAPLEASFCSRSSVVDVYCQFPASDVQRGNPPCGAKCRVPPTPPAT